MGISLRTIHIPLISDIKASLKVLFSNEIKSNDIMDKLTISWELGYEGYSGNGRAKFFANKERNAV